MSESIVLASGSPRRAELLDQIRVSYRVFPVDVDESIRPGESPEDFACRLAREKARAGHAAVGLDKPTLGADTVVVCDGRALGKPGGRDEALAMLRLLSGREHRVLSAVALAEGPRCELRLSTSRVWFRTLGEAELAAYWDSGEPVDKAGAYAIQGLGAVFVERLEGSYSGVMGLPLYETTALLREFGVDPLAETKR